MLVNKIAHPRGVTIIGLIVSIAIFGVLIVTIAAFQLSIFRSYNTYEARSQTDQRMITFVRNITRELRTSQQSALGSYLIASAQDNELVFYSDIGANGIVDRIRYTLNGSILERGITAPSGNPLTYDLGNEKISNLVTSVTVSPKLLTYFGSDYNGIDSVDPLPEPLQIADIRVVKMEFTIDTGVEGAKPVFVKSLVTIRNLKDID